MAQYGTKSQTAPLAYTGVPTSEQVQVPYPEQQFAVQPPSQVPAPTVQVPIRDQAANQQTAVDQVSSQEAAAAQRYPTQDFGSILAVLSGIAGNVAGALTGQGAVGTPGIQLSENIQRRNREQQDNFVARTRQSEELARRDELELEKAQNLQLQANSLAPLVNRIPDPQMQAYIYGELSAGRVEDADRLVKEYWNNARQVHVDAANREHKMEVDSLRRENLDRQRANDELSNQLKEVRLKSELREFDLKPLKERQKIVASESKDYSHQIQKIREPISAYTTIEETLGGLESPGAREKISRLLGIAGGLRSRITGTPEDKRLFQNIQRLFATIKTEDFGQSFTGSEKDLMETASGVALSGSPFANVFKTPDQFIEGLRIAKKGLVYKLQSAAANKQPETLRGFEAEGIPLTLRSFTEHLAKVSAGGGVDLDKVPPGVNPDDWLRMDKTTRGSFHQNIKGGR